MKSRATRVYDDSVLTEAETVVYVCLTTILHHDPVSSELAVKGLLILMESSSVQL